MSKGNFVNVRAYKSNIYVSYFLMFPSVGLDYDTCSRQNILHSNTQIEHERKMKKKRVECFFFKCVYYATLFSFQKSMLILGNNLGKHNVIRNT